GATAVVNAFTSDTINGVAASSANAVLSLASGSTVPAGLTFDTATGNVNVAAGTPAGTYSFNYTICEKLNPGNCQTATISVTVVAAAIAADPDTAPPVNGATGSANVVDVLDGDTLNGAPVTLAQVDLTVTTPATPATPGAPVPTLDVATGQVSVPAGTPAGTYSIVYEICEKLNPGNCASNTVSITIEAASIAADNESVSGINGLAGQAGVLDVLDGDTLNGAPASLSSVNLSVTTAATPINGGPVPTLNPATGLVDVPAGTPAGSYSIVYEICEKLNPGNCATATATVTVAPSIDLEITKTDGKTDVFSGETVTYSLTITNLGPDTATGAVVRDVPGAGLTCPATNVLTFSGAGIPSGSFTIADLVGSGVTLGSLAQNQSVTITYSCTVE
ncbi:DUF11 domain-containing protein, partial [Parerythrobacter aurantius]|uniref:DUF11 domain-containing protein n=1 Tax=Parerythrobacter aurantius TaxID=3127706 RepID=UPI0032457928